MQTAKFTDMPLGSPLSVLHQLSEEHSLYDRMLETLRAKPMPTEQEMLEEVRLKKMKLRLKDEMELLRRQSSSCR
jgi:uncharacterized protein